MDISMKTAAVNLNAFHRFAALNKADGNRIAQFGATRNIQVATGDHIRTPFRDAFRAGLFAHWGRHGEANARANDKIREFFITSVLRTLGCNLDAHGISYDAQTDRYTGINKTNLKSAAMSVLNNDEAAVKILKLGDYGRGRPLSVFRITAAVSLVDKVLETRAKLEDENGVNRQLRQGIHMGGFAEDVAPQNVQEANELPQPNNVVAPQRDEGQMRPKFIDLPKPKKNESVGTGPLLIPRENYLTWARDVIQDFRIFLSLEDDYAWGFYNPSKAKEDAEKYNTLMRLGEESNDVQRLLDANQALLDEMRSTIEDNL